MWSTSSRACVHSSMIPIRMISRTQIIAKIVLWPWLRVMTHVALALCCSFLYPACFHSSSVNRTTKPYGNVYGTETFKLQWHGLLKVGICFITFCGMNGLMFRFLGPRYFTGSSFSGFGFTEIEANPSFQMTVSSVFLLDSTFFYGAGT